MEEIDDLLERLHKALAIERKRAAEKTEHELDLVEELRFWRDELHSPNLFDATTGMLVKDAAREILHLFAAGGLGERPTDEEVDDLVERLRRALAIEQAHAEALASQKEDRKTEPTGNSTTGLGAEAPPPTAWQQRSLSDQGRDIFAASISRT